MSFATLTFFTNASFVANTATVSFDSRYYKNVALYGTGTTVDAHNLIVQVSNDNVNFYNTTFMIARTAASTIPFYLEFVCSARYIRIMNTATSNITNMTMHINAKS